MKTWFSKDEQKWVSDIPRAFWLGIYDAKTKEKLYSDDIIYDISKFTIWLYKKPRNISQKCKDCSKCNFESNQIPYTYLRTDGKYTKYI